MPQGSPSAYFGLIPLEPDAITYAGNVVLSLFHPQNVASWSKMRLFMQIKYADELKTIEIMLGCILLAVLGYAHCYDPCVNENVCWICDNVIIHVLSVFTFLISELVRSGTADDRFGITLIVVTLLSVYVIIPLLVIMQTGVEINTLFEG
jgi:hypothetical protein